MRQVLNRLDWVAYVGRVGFFLIVVVAISQNAFAADSNNDSIKIGLTPPLSGIESSEGKFAVNSAELAVREVNAEGGIGGRKLELLVEDNHSTPDGALGAYVKLAQVEKVSAIIASAKSAQIVALLPKSSKLEIVTMIGGTNARLTEGNPWIFRMRPDDTIAASAMVKYILAETKFKKIGIINDDGAFGAGGANLIEKFAKDAQLSITKRESFTTGHAEFTPLLKRIEASGAEVLISYVPNYSEQGAIELALGELHSKMMFLGSPASVTKVATDISKAASEGIYAVVDTVLGATPASHRYAESYRKEFKTEPDSQSSYAYDSVKVLAHAMALSGPASSELRQAIFKIHGYDGALGEFEFDPNGNGLHAVSIVKIEQGKIKLIKVVRP